MNPLNTRQKVGVALAALFSLSNVPSAFMPGVPEGEVGPPMAVLVFGTVLGVVGLVATVPAWRGHGVAMRLLAGSCVLALLTSLPAFFVDVPTAIKVAVAVSVIWVVAACALMFSGSRVTAQAPATYAR